MTKSVQPIIAILLAVMAYQFFLTAYENSGVFHLVYYWLWLAILH